MGTTLFLLLRAPRPLPLLTADDQARMRDLLVRHGERDSLGYFALRGDKSVVWSPSGKSCIAYRVTSGVMLASGDPLGDPEAWPGAIAQFVAEAKRHAWIPAVAAASETGAEVWVPRGRRSTRSSSATRPSSRSPTSRSTAARCATSGRW